MEPEGSSPCSLVPILNQMNPVHTTPSHPSKIHFNIVAYGTVTRQRPRKKKTTSTAVAMKWTNKQTAVSEQMLGKHVPAESKTHATIEEWCLRCVPCKVFIKKRTGVIQSVEGWQFSWALQGRQKKWGYSWVDSWQEFCTGGCDKRTWAREAEESPLLEAVARERLVKTAGWKRLSGCCGDL
jgi:hypothetical protein